MDVLAVVIYVALVIGPVVWLQLWLMAGSNLDSVKDRARIASVWPVIIPSVFVCIELLRAGTPTLENVAVAWLAVWLLTLLLARPIRWWVHLQPR